MPRLTVTITDEQAELLEEKTGDGSEYESKSEAVRYFIQEYGRLKTEVEELRNERDRLQRQLAATNKHQEEVTELVEYVEEQREVERYRDRRQRKIDQVGCAHAREVVANRRPDQRGRITMPECAECGEYVTQDFIQVFGIDGEVYGCRHCLTQRELNDGDANTRTE